MLDTENITDVLEKISWFNLEAWHLWEHEDFTKSIYQFNPVQYGGIMSPQGFP